MVSQERFTVLVCHASPVVQAGLVALLARHGDLECTVGGGIPPIQGGEAIPDAIVTDHGSAIEWVRATHRMEGRRARPRVLVVAHSDRECDIRAAISAGVQGYLLIDDAPEHLAAAIRSVQPGRRILSPKVASRLAESVAGEALTHREQAVLRLVIEGCCNKSIANRLGITSGTVKSHLRSAFGKLGVASRTQAVAMAHRRGLFQQHAASLPHEDLPAASPRPPLFDDHDLRFRPGLSSVSH
jgi:DNA-binding NarL/FixJ family response regulator